MRAGFTDPVVATRTTTYASPDERIAWGGLWEVRVVESDFADHATRNGLVTRAELAEISAAFRRWYGRPDAFWAFLNTAEPAVRP